MLALLPPYREGIQYHGIILGSWLNRMSRRKKIHVTYLVFADGTSVFFKSDPIAFHAHLQKWQRMLPKEKHEEYRVAGCTNGAIEILMFEDEYLSHYKRMRFTLAEERKIKPFRLGEGR